MNDFSHCAVLISFLSLLFLATKVYSGWVNAYVCVYVFIETKSIKSSVDEDS